MIISLLVAAIIGVLTDWLLKSLLPKRADKAYHFISAFVAILFLLLITYVFSEETYKSNSISIQHGETAISNYGKSRVYYQEPFNQIPKLEVISTEIRLSIEKQEKKYFEYNISESTKEIILNKKFQWKATGLSNNIVLEREKLDELKGLITGSTKGRGEVFYTREFRSPPNVTFNLNGIFAYVSLKEQRTDGFTYDISYTGGNPGENIEWIAKGKFIRNKSETVMPSITGSLNIISEGEFEVTYPYDFKRKPYLTVYMNDSSQDVTIIEQTKSGFRYRVNNTPYYSYDDDRTIRWRAIGEKETLQKSSDTPVKQGALK